MPTTMCACSVDLLVTNRRFGGPGSTGVRTGGASFAAASSAMSAYRRSTPDLATGAWTAIDAPDGVLAYRRGSAHAVVLNLGNAPATVPGIDGTIVIGTRRALDSTPVSGDLTLSPGEGAVLRRRSRGTRSRRGGRRAPMR